MKNVDILIIGGGAAGMSAAISACKKGKKVILADENKVLGGILNQCIHTGFGLSYFKEDLTGVEYADRLYTMLKNTDAEIFIETTVIKISEDRSALLSNKNGITKVSFKHLMLATGCIEKTIGSLPVSGTRPKGIFTAGEAQRIINIDHKDVGDDIVILGSGDIGQIMARRFRILGKNVIAMVEINDHLGGLKLNHKRCIEAYDIPYILNSTVDEVVGKDYIEGVWIKNIKTNERLLIPCHTLITAIGLTPDRSLIEDFEDIPQWITLCGNSDYVHEIVDAVSMQAEEKINDLYK
ncbi:MAG: FAD-dependent oxidoreductase [Lachnospiraceae bacterium]|nr:FAD-dependent oxidoreductase [Lachnospiraceae bacterium]